MKKRISLLLAATLVVSTMLTACGGGNNNEAKSGEVKVGVGIKTDFAGNSVGDEVHGKVAETGNAQADITMAAVSVDKDGKIVDVKVDCVQVKCGFDATGKLAAGNKTDFKTKKELGSEYGMKDASAAAGKIEGGAEWFEQAEHFEKWAKGKTIDQIKGIAGADGKATDENILAGCTMAITDMQDAVVRAMEGATWTGASEKDTLGLGATAVLNKPMSVGDNENDKETGSCQAYVNVAAVTKAADGKVTCAAIDSVQANSKWDATGKIAAAEEPKTKYALKEGYGMKEASAAAGKIEGGAEWYQQIEFFQKAVKGKTIDEIKAFATDESGHPTDDTITAGCTMSINAYRTAMEKAMK